jgi:hypothetical protein
MSTHNSKAAQFSTNTSSMSFFDNKYTKYAINNNNNNNNTPPSNEVALDIILFCGAPSN